ncbi:MAG: cobamide remodeling phosphodiesterase CbiR [Desulfovibrionaceae bacterium]
MGKLAFAAPSCVIPGTVAENAHFLAGKVAEVALCLFETRSCLEYGVEDLPITLKELDLSWHVHLPVDIPREAGGRPAAAHDVAVVGKVAYLAPRLAVLHPPHHPQTATLLRDFAMLWREYSALPLLLENIDTAPLVDLQACIIEANYGICLDVGHALGYAQKALLANTCLLQRVALAHWSAPGQRDQHLPLTALRPDEWSIARQVALSLPADTRHVLEIFHWNGVETSAPVLQHLLRRAEHE